MKLFNTDFAGLFLDLDSDDDMELSPMEQLDSSLNQFHQAVQHLCGVMKEAPKLNGRYFRALLVHSFRMII